MPILGIVASQVPGRLPVGAFESIATTTVGSGGISTVTFSSIPSTYKHLQIRYIARSGRSRVATGGLTIRFNGSYSTYGHEIQGDGSAASASGGVPSIGSLHVCATGVDAASATFGAGYIDILDYANTNKVKTIRALSAADTNGAGQVKYLSTFINSTSAISSITFETVDGGTNIQQYSSFALYGIKG